MQEAIYEGKYFDLKLFLESKTDVKAELEMLKKRGDKGAFLCPYCNGTLILKSGEIREEHFAHRHSKSCEISVASEVYQQQVKRESNKHSVMKEIIYDELKTQEKINENLQVEYGYVIKASEKWRYYPDIIIDNKGKELAITILTNVTSQKDEKLVKQIKKRNGYFKDKNLEPVWFIENSEQSIDMEHRVIHLWEAELDISIKTAEDLRWEEMLNSYKYKYPLFELFNYYHKNSPSFFDVNSLYYVHSTETNIVFEIQRFIKDEINYPFRAFALNDTYQISLSKALNTTLDFQLSDPIVEERQRKSFGQLIIQKEAEYFINLRKMEIITPTPKFSLSDEEFSVSEGYFTPQVKKAKNKHNSSKNIVKKGDFSKEIQAFIQNVDRFSAEELSEYLVLECGASSETFSTGRYKIYMDVCNYLEILEGTGVIELVKRDFVNDRFYKVRKNYQIN